MDTNILNDNIYLITNLLEEISKVNKMIRMHRSRGEEGDFMASQYEYHKLGFVEELRELLVDYDIAITPKPELVAA